MDHDGGLADVIAGMPTLAQDQTCDMKYDDGSRRVWLSRMGPEDGSCCYDHIQIEALVDGRWVISESHCGPKVAT